MKTKHKNLFVLMTSLFLFSIEVFADVPTETKIVDIRYSQENEPTLIYHLNKEKYQILRNDQHPDQYFLLRGGVKILSEKPNRIRTYFVQDPGTASCIGENIEDKSFTVGNNIDSLKDKISLFRQCISFYIEDDQKANIDFVPNQQDCQINKINDYSALISGGDCFIKSKANQQLKVELRTNPLCNNLEFLEKKRINPLEMEGVLEAYIYPEAEIGPVFTPTKQLWNQQILVNLNPDHQLLDMVLMDGKNGEMFYRPENFVVPDLMITNLRLFNQEKLGLVELGFLISNLGGKKFCFQNLCSSYQNFDLPFAPLFVLYEYNPRNNKKHEIAYSGGVGGRLPGQWNGEMESKIYLYNVAFEKGKKYSIELTFADPTQDYLRLKKFYNSLLKESLSIGNFVPGLGELRAIEGFDGISGGIGVVPSLTTEGNFASRGLPKDLELNIARILQNLNDPTFPPNYSQICKKDMTFCKKIGSKDHTKFIIDFEVVDVKDSKGILGEIKVERISDFLPRFQTILDLKKKPLIKCN